MDPLQDGGLIYLKDGLRSLFYCPPDVIVILLKLLFPISFLLQMHVLFCLTYSLVYLYKTSYKLILLHGKGLMYHKRTLFGKNSVNEFDYALNPKVS